MMERQITSKCPSMLVNLKINVIIEIQEYGNITLNPIVLALHMVEYQAITVQFRNNSRKERKRK